jgi:large repetitive protein
MHVLTATYAGDSNFLGTTASAATAGATTISVGGPDSALTVIPGVSFTVIPGGAVNFELLLTPQPGAYPGPVTFTMTGLPPGATVSFAPSSLNAVTSPTTVQVAIQTAAATAKLTRIRGDSEAIVLSLLLLPIGCRGRTRKRLGQVSLFAFLLIGVLFSMVITGCGDDSGFLRQEPQNYTLTITATSGPVQHIATVTLNVQ